MVAVRDLVGQGVSVRATGDQGRTALIAAAYRDHLDVALVSSKREPT